MICCISEGRKKDGSACPAAQHQRRVRCINTLYGGTKPPYRDSRHKKCLSLSGRFPRLWYVEHHKYTINFGIIYNFAVKRKNRCFMLNSFVTPCQVSPKGARSGYVRQITSKALYLSSLDHLYKLTWCIFRVELFYLWSNPRSKTVHFRSRRSLYRR